MRIEHRPQSGWRIELDLTNEEVANSSEHHALHRELHFKEWHKAGARLYAVENLLASPDSSFGRSIRNSASHI